MTDVSIIVVAHNDEAYPHLHIVASKINPATGRAYDLKENYLKLSRWAEAYEELTVDLDRIVDAGDRLVSIHRVRGRARHTGIEAEGPVAYVWTFRDRKVIHFQSYRDPEEALAAAGLREGTA